MAKRRLTTLKLTHIAAVTLPCQEGAQAVLMKRREDPVDPSALAKGLAKYVSCDDGAHSFDEVLAENRLSEIIWPLADAFMQSVRSIVGDKALSTGAREAMIAETVDEFLSAVRMKAPAADAEKVESELAKLIKEGDPTMKTVETLTAEIAELTKTHTAAIEALTGERDTHKARAEAAEIERDALKAKVEEPERELAAAKTEIATLKASLATATDETLTVAGKQVKKSVFGAEQFDVLKAQEERAQLAEMSKRAEAEFSLVVGTTAEKALVLKGIETLDEGAKKAATAILVSAQDMAKLGFDTFGVTGEQQKTVEKAQTDFSAKVAEIVARDSCGQTEAMQKARQEAPELFDAMQSADV